MNIPSPDVYDPNEPGPTYADGIRKGLPIALALIPIGMTFGVLARLDGWEPSHPSRSRPWHSQLRRNLPRPAWWPQAAASWRRWPAPGCSTRDSFRWAPPPRPPSGAGFDERPDSEVADGDLIEAAVEGDRDRLASRGAAVGEVGVVDLAAGLHGTQAVEWPCAGRASASRRRR